MHIGIDFDNTIVCYDQVFYKVAKENGLISPDTPGRMPRGKNNVRDYLRKTGKEDEWTKLQGLVYGTKMNHAEVFEGIFDYLYWCRQNKIEVSIISHKTRHPYIGPKYDLHTAAFDWMEKQGFFVSDKIGLTHDHIFFEKTKADKIKRIAARGCTHFIDDLPEFLLEPSFPKNVIRILFNPNDDCEPDFRFHRASSWAEVLKNQVGDTAHIRVG